jgi:hypothetical protein
MTTTIEHTCGKVDVLVRHSLHICLVQLIDVIRSAPSLQLYTPFGRLCKREILRISNMFSQRFLSLALVFLLALASVTTAQDERPSKRYRKCGASDQTYLNACAFQGKAECNTAV